jgi:hypothetical protein
MTLRLITVPSSHGGFLPEVQQKTTYVAWSSSWHSAVIIIISRAIHVDGKHISKCTLDPNCLKI